MMVANRKKVLFLLCLILMTTSDAVANDETLSDFERIKGANTENAIPLVNISVDTTAMTKDEYIVGTIEIFDPLARTNNAEDVKLNCKVKYRGATSLAYDKKSFAIKTLDENGEKADVSFFGIREDDSWILDAMAIDRLRMRNRLCFDLWNEISRTPHETDYGNRNGTLGVFVEVFINGTYHGLYCMTDKINRKLLGLKKAKEKDDGSVSVRGVLYKGESWTNATTLWGYDLSQSLDAETWNGWELQYPDDYPSEQAWQPLMDFIDLFQLSDDSFATVYADHLYTDNLLSYAILIMATNYGDCIMKNTFLSNPDITKGSKFIITPWDMDMSLGGYYNGEYYDVLSDIANLENSKLFNYLISNNIDGFQDSLRTKWSELALTIFLPENVYKRIDDYAERFLSSGAWQREYEKWNGNPVPLYKDLTDEATYVKDWYARNYKNVCEILGTEAGVVDVMQQADAQESFIYTIGGVRIVNDRKAHGIVIENGKKVMLQ